MSSKATKKPQGGKKKAVVEEAEAEVKKAGAAVRKGAKRLEREVERKRSERQKEPRPKGRPPVALVSARHGIGVVSREGRGFSLGELSGAGLAPAVAPRWGLRVDIRRRSVVEENVDSLKAWAAHPSEEARLKGEAKKAEEKLVEAGEEVERGAVKVAKEAEGVVKKAGKEAKMAEMAV